jgi:hypothetical protein
MIATRLICAIALTLLATTCSNNRAAVAPAYTPLIESDGSPSRILRRLFETLKLKAETVENMNTIAQKDFLRKPNQERWEMDDRYEKQKADIYPILQALGVTHEIVPSQGMYESVNYVCLHGARVTTMRDRIKFLLDHWKKFPVASKERIKVVFFAGDRALDAKIEGADVLLNPQFARPGWIAPKVLPTTEVSAAELLWDQMVDNEALRQKVSFVQAPLKEDGKRPTTGDTIIEWINSSHVDLDSAHILAISNNPYIPYQDLVFINILLDKGFRAKALETVGSAANPDTSIAVHLDNIARWLYESIKNLKLKQSAQRAS